MEIKQTVSEDQMKQQQQLNVEQEEQQSQQRDQQQLPQTVVLQTKHGRIKQEFAERARGLWETGKVMIPQNAAEATYAKEYKNQVFAGKRKVNRTPGTVRPKQKREEAKTVAAEHNAYQEKIQMRREAIAGKVAGQTERYHEAAAHFLESENAREELLERGNKESFLQTAIDNFMQTDLDLDMRTTRSFVASMSKIEEVIGKTDAMIYLLYHSPDTMNELRENNESGFAELMAKLKYAINVSRYCKVQKEVLTDPYYQRHYNSEIGFRARDEDTVEQKRLTRKLLMAESLRRNIQSSKFSIVDWFFAYQQLAGKNEKSYTKRKNKAMHSRDLEESKNNPGFEETTHRDFFKAIHEEDGVTRARLTASGFHVAGQTAATSEGLMRQVAAMARWKAVQSATREEVQSMVHNLSMVPQNADDEEEIARCAEANIQGVLQYKAMIKDQLDYLQRKYGTGLEYLSAEEFEKHQADYMQDFTDMQAIDNFILYMKKAGFINEDDTENNDPMTDLEMVKLQNYYGTIFRSRNAAASPAFSDATYSGKKAVEIFTGIGACLVQNSQLELEGDDDPFDMLVKNDDHTDVRWDTKFARPNRSF